MTRIKYSTRHPPSRAHSATPHPSGGKGFGYAVDFRAYAMMRNALGGEDNLTQQLQTTHLYPSVRTIQRYRRRMQSLGHLRRFHRTGNNRATVLRGHASYLLMLYRVAFPKAQLSQVNAFLFNALGRQRFFHPSQISKAEQRLGLSRKRGSTTAKQAMLPRNIAIRYTYWNMPYPFGIANIRRRDLIDIDESGIFLETADMKIGKALFGRRVKEIGNYGHGKRINFLFAIAGSQQAERWMELWDQGGLDLVRFLAFIQRILNDIGPGTPQRRWCFTMDNCSTHRSALVTHLIHAHGHRIVFRVPCYPVDGPIEYVFNTIQYEIALSMYNIHTIQQLINKVYSIVGLIGSFVNYFINCGFILP